MKNNIKYDLEERTAKFGEAIFYKRIVLRIDNRNKSLSLKQILI
jgi:hypothetical protein